MDDELQALIDLHNNILLIGGAATNYKLNEIAYFESADTVIELYGDSTLTRAFKTAKDFGVENVFLINVKNPKDYLSLAQNLKHQDFSYIVPTDIIFSDCFNDPMRNNAKIPFCQYMLEQMNGYNDSVIIMTEKHASLYQDIDEFMSDMSSAVTQFKAKAAKSSYLENICFVANNLVDYELSSIVLASMLCVNTLDHYPILDVGEAIFDLDISDVGFEMAFFKNNTLTNTTIENLVNFKIGTPEKIVTISRIVKFIKRELNLEEFKGRFYNRYQMIRIETKLQSFLNSLLNYLIEKYEIESITPYRNEDAGTVTIVVVFSIWPVNSIEKCTMRVET